MADIKGKTSNKKESTNKKEPKKALSDPYTTELHQIMSKLEISASDVQRMQYLIENKKAKLNSIGYDGKTLLEKAVYRNSPELFQFLRSLGADINQRNGKLETPLHTATFLKNSNMIDEILRANPDINAQDSNGETALLIAVKQNDAHSVSTLLTHKADPNKSAKGGEVPMTEVMDPQIATELLQNGARVNVVTKEGKDPLQQAENLQDDKLIAEILEAKIKEEKHISDQNSEVQHKEETREKESEKANQANGPVDKNYKQSDPEQDLNEQNQSDNLKKEEQQVPRLTPNNRLSRILKDAAQHSVQNKNANNEEKKKQVQDAVETYKKMQEERRSV